MLLTAFCKTRRGRPLVRCLCAFACLLLLSNTQAQTISLSLKDAPLESVFREIQQQTDYRFVYTDGLLEQAKKVSIHVQGAAIQPVLEQVFKDQPLGYTIEEKIIMVRRNGKAIISPSDGITVKGKVIDEEGNGLPSVTLALKDKASSTATDEQGNFVLRGIDPLSVVWVSSVGYASKQVPIGGRSSILIQLNKQLNALEETVIKGYYATTRQLNTGSVSKIKSEDISRQPVNNVLAAMEGFLPGVTIQQNTGAPGGAWTVRVRGQNSIASGNDPLYIIDGVPFSSSPVGSIIINVGITAGGNPLSSINPSDIESIEVLKDADATAIYGSRGSNGVILITTKKGPNGKAKLDADLHAGFSRVGHFVPLLNTPQYVSMRKEAFANDGVIPVATPTTGNARDLILWDTTRYTDWQKTLIGGSAPLLDAKLSLSAGNEHTRFMLAGGYTQEGTVFPGDFRYTKTNTHFSIDHLSANKKFKLLFSGGYAQDASRMPQLDLASKAVLLPPDAPAVFDNNGKLNWPDYSFDNPYGYLRQLYKSKTDNLIGNAVISYEILPGLQLKANLGYTKTSITEISTKPGNSLNTLFVAAAPSFYTASAYFGSSSFINWIMEPQAAWHQHWKNQQLDILVGTSFQRSTREGQVFKATGFSNDGLIENIGAATSLVTDPSSPALYTDYHYQAVFARIGYNARNRYVLNLTARRDGSSRFGTGKQWADFGAAGFAWIISREKFFQPLLGTVSFAKIRLSYGITGNDQIADYGYLGTYAPTPYAYQGSGGLYPVRINNPYYGWETTKKAEIGLELGFAKDRLLFTGNYFRNRSSNQLVGYSLPLVTGYASIQENLPALLQNSGIELQLNAVIMKRARLAWSAGFNLTIPRNKLLAYPNLKTSAYANTYALGESLNIKKLYHSTGVDPLTGLYQFENMAAGNGSSTLTPSYPGDLQAIKKVGQDYYGGLQNTVQYRNWELGLLIQFVSQTGRNYLYGGFLTPGFLGNQPVEVLNHWKQKGDIAPVQKYSQAYSDQWNAYNLVQSYGDNTISDASFVRLKNISLSYHLPAGWMQRAHLQQCSIYIQAQNIWTKTNYTGFDPENQNITRLPPLRTLVAGIHCTL